MVGGDRGGSQPPTAAAPPSMQQAQRGKAEQPVTRGATYAMFFAKVDASLGSSWDSPLPYTRFLPPESTAPAAAPATAAASAMGATARERVSVHAAWLEYKHRRLWELRTTDALDGRPDGDIRHWHGNCDRCRA
jgi:hypothetical protein